MDKMAKAMEMLKEAMELVEMAMENPSEEMEDVAEVVKEEEDDSSMEDMDKKGLVLSMMKKKDTKMERLELMIDEARVLSQNEKYDADSGLSQAVFVRYFKNAQDTIVREIVNTKSKYLLTEKVYPTVNGQEEYAWPKDIYLHNVDTCEFSENGREYVFLDKVYSKDRMNDVAGYAFGYMPRESGFLMVPPVIGGATIRLSYIKNLPAPQIRHGRILSSTVSGDQVTAITLDPADPYFNPTFLNKYEVLCVVSRKGELKASGIEFTSIDPLTGVITLSAHTLEAGESLANGDYVCAGKYVVNKIQLPDICESFLINHVVFEAKYGDSSRWSKEAQGIMRAHLMQLIESFSKNTDDINEVIVTNLDYLT